MRRAIVLTCCGLLALALLLAAKDPVAFQKIGALTDAELPPLDPAQAADVTALIRAMPDLGAAGSDETVYDVLPSRRRDAALVGRGNCSNLVFGLAYELLERGDEFEVVHLMPRETFLDAQGHTLLRAELARPEGKRVVLVDVAAAAIPSSGGRALDLLDLARGAIPGFSLDPIRAESEDWSRFYAPAFQSDLLLGRIPSADIERYFRFVEVIHVDLGLPARLEKILYQGIGVTLGIYPRIHVESLAPVWTSHPLRFALLRGALWTLRIAPLVLLGCGLWWWIERERARRDYSAESSHSRIF